MWKFYPKTPRRFVIVVFSLKVGEVERFYVNEKDLSSAFQKAIDKYEDEYQDLLVNINVYEILTDDWVEEEGH